MQLRQRKLPRWQVILYASGSLAVATLLLFFVPRDFYSGLLFTALFGFVLAGLLMLPDLLIADVVDADELDTGTRREGLYFGMKRMIALPTT